jgi:hypothetical protein
MKSPKLDAKKIAHNSELLSVSLVQTFVKMNDSIAALSAYIVIESVQFTLCIAGNLLVIFIVITSGKFRTSSYQCIMNVAIADLLLGLIAIPSAILKVIQV